MTAWPHVKPGSGNDRVLNLLSDRRYHTSHELQVGLQVMAHSRLSELRDRGYTFEQRRVPGGKGLHQFEYKLTGTPLGETEIDQGPTSLATVSVSPSGSHPATTLAPAGGAAQLPLFLLEAA